MTLAVAHSPFGLGKSSSSSCLAVFFSDSPFCELLKTATTIKKCTRRVEGDRENKGNKEDKAQKWHTKAAGQWRINWPIGKLRLCSTCRQNLPTCRSALLCLNSRTTYDLCPLCSCLARSGIDQGNCCAFGSASGCDWHFRMDRFIAN